MKTNFKKSISRLIIFCVIMGILTSALSVSAFAGSWSFKGEGWYKLYPKCASTKCLDVENDSTKDGANLQIFDSISGSNGQWFYFASVGNGYYMITAKCSGKVLDIKGGSSKSGANVQQWYDKFGDNQIWKVESAGNGYYYLKPSNNEKLALDVAGGVNKRGANVQVYKFSKNNSAQMWKLWNGNTNISYTSVTGIKSTSNSKAVTYYVKPNGDSKVTVRALNSPLFGYGHYILEESSRFRVRIISDSGKVIVNKIVTGKSNTFSVKSKYGNYRVEITRYGSWADDIMWNPNLGYYCQVSLTNAKIK